MDTIHNSLNSWIDFSVNSDESAILISVTDSGKLSKEAAEKIFEPFFSTKEVGAGKGLGLSIAKSLIESHGGELQHDPYCAYTRFTIRLPVANILSVDSSSSEAS